METLSHTCTLAYISTKLRMGIITISGGGGTTKRWAIYIYVNILYISKYLYIYIYISNISKYILYTYIHMATGQYI